MDKTTAKTMETVRCEWCGQGATDEYPVWGHKERGESPHVISHQTRSYCTWAALARAEAAEAEAARLAARVAELESQLAAQQWRPVTEEWPPYEESTPVRMRNGVIRWGYRRGDFWYLTGGKHGREGVTHAYELPPAPQETE